MPLPIMIAYTQIRIADVIVICNTRRQCTDAVQRQEKD